MTSAMVDVRPLDRNWDGIGGLMMSYKVLIGESPLCQGMRNRMRFVVQSWLKRPDDLLNYCA